LERHLTRRPWGENLDVAVDRWRLNLEQRRNLEDYLRTNYRLRPMIGYITMVDSVYADPVQVADIYARVARRVLTGDADREKEELCRRLMDLSEVTGGCGAPAARMRPEKGRRPEPLERAARASSPSCSGSTLHQPAHTS
jgi:hypothetical protein